MPDASSDVMSKLFGRGLLYVVIWSLQITVLTVISPLLAHLLGPGQFGRVSAAIALHQVLMVVAVFGIDQAVVLAHSEGSHENDNSEARGLLAVSMCIAALVTTLVYVTGGLWAGELGFGGFNGVVIPTVLWTAPAGACLAMLGFLRAEDRLGAFTAVSFVTAVCGQILGIGLILLGHRTALDYAWGGVIAQCAGLAIGIAVCRPRLAGLVSFEPLWRAVRLGFPVVLGGLAIFVVNAGDRFVLQIDLGPAATGRYQVAFTIGAAASLLLTFVNQSWAPSIFAIREEEERWKVVARVRDESLAVIAPVLLGLIVVVPVLLPIVAPADFHTSSLRLVTYFIALATVPIVISASCTRILLSCRKPRAIAIAAGAASVVTIAVNVALVPVWGPLGSAIANLIAFSCQALVLTVAVRPITQLPAPPRRVVWTLAAIAAIGLGALYLPDSDLMVGARCAALLACGVWALLLIRNVRRDGYTATTRRNVAFFGL
ncbi:MAG: oligosaccharide flippase family protein [Acidimicrobiales bacterium]|jgi:O-antigen/teichoic acid export membrane protein